MARGLRRGRGGGAGASLASTVGAPTTVTVTPEDVAARSLEASEPLARRRRSESAGRAGVSSAGCTAGCSATGSAGTCWEISAVFGCFGSIATEEEVCASGVGAPASTRSGVPDGSG